MRPMLGDVRVRAALPWLAMALAAAGMTPAAVPTSGEWWRTLPLAALLVAGMLVGVGTIALAVVRDRTLAARGAWLALGTLVALPIAAAVSMFAILFGPLVLVVPFGVLALAVVALALRGGAHGPAAVMPAAGGVAVGLVAVGVGLLDGLVWLPLALATGFELDAISAELARRGETHGIPMLVTWAAASALAVLVAGLAALRRRTAPGRTAAMAIAPAVAALLLLPWWEFSMGMSLSDALPPGGGGGMSDAMPWVGALAAVLAGVATRLALPAAAATTASDAGATQPAPV